MNRRIRHTLNKSFVLLVERNWMRMIIFVLSAELVIKEVCICSVPNVVHN